MGFINIYSMKFGLVLNLLTGFISPQYRVVFNGMFSTVASITFAYSEVCIRLVVPRKSRIQIMLYQ